MRKLPKSSEPLRQLGRAPRKLNNRLVSEPRPVSVLHPQVDSSLHPRRTFSRQLQPACPRSRLAKNICDPNSIPESVRIRSGILGPSPLSSHRKELPNPKSRLTKDEGSDILPHPSGSNSSKSGLPHSPSQTSSRASENLRRPLHLHKSDAHSSHLRPSWIRKDPVKQTRIQLGHCSSLGSPSDLRPLNSILPTPSVVHASSVTPRQTPRVPDEKRAKARSDGLTSSNSSHLHGSDSAQCELEGCSILQRLPNTLAESSRSSERPNLIDPFSPLVS